MPITHTQWFREKVNEADTRKEKELCRDKHGAGTHINTDAKATTLASQDMTMNR
jgi:hypothetical protein